MASPAELYSAVEAAELCGITHRTLARAIERGELVGAHYAGSGHRRVRRPDLIEWLIRTRRYAALERIGQSPRLLCVNLSRRDYEFLKFRPEGNRTLACDGHFEAGIIFSHFAICSVLFRLEGAFEAGLAAARIVCRHYPGRDLGAILPAGCPLTKPNRALFDRLYCEPFDQSALLAMLPGFAQGRP